MATSLEELKILQIAEGLADEIWKAVMAWNAFAREVVGGQFVRAIDSIGANIAEAFGRFYYGEKLQFLYYARGSLFEAKYWINRAKIRDLMPAGQAQHMADQLTELARKLNMFAASVKTQRQDSSNPPRSSRIREDRALYVANPMDEIQSMLFSDTDLEYLSQATEISNSK